MLYHEGLIKYKHASMVKSLFKVNDYICLSLKDDRVNIMVEGKEFMICKGVAIRIPVMELHEIQESTSIDDLTSKYNKINEEENEIYSGETEITSETEFLVHCSNLQAWAENDYDTTLLHTNLAFPLLKRLCRAGDQQAKKIFKEEIVKRYLEGNEKVQKFLAVEEYLNILTSEERQLLFKKNTKELHVIESLVGRRLEIRVDVLLGSGVELL